MCQQAPAQLTWQWQWCLLRGFVRSSSALITSSCKHEVDAEPSISPLPLSSWKFVVCVNSQRQGSAPETHPPLVSLIKDFLLRAQSLSLIQKGAAFLHLKLHILVHLPLIFSAHCDESQKKKRKVVNGCPGLWLNNWSTLQFAAYVLGHKMLI